MVKSDPWTKICDDLKREAKKRTDISKLHITLGDLYLPTKVPIKSNSTTCTETSSSQSMIKIRAYGTQKTVTLMSRRVYQASSRSKTLTSNVWTNTSTNIYSNPLS